MAKPSFVFYNIGGDWLPIAQRVDTEGFPVYFVKSREQSNGLGETGIGYFKDDEKQISCNLFEVLNGLEPENTIVLFDDNGQGDLAVHLRESGFKVIGGSTFSDEIEYDRSLGLKFMEKIGLEVPFEKEFTDLDEGIDFLKTESGDVKYVFKPNGEDLAGSSMTYTAKNGRDLIDYMGWVKKDMERKAYKIDKFVLQEFVEGIEADFAGYFDGEKFMPNLCLLDVEEKKSGDGNKGEATGCMGNVIVNFPASRYFTEYIEKLTPMLKKDGYVGEISINNIFAKGQKSKHQKYEAGMPYGLEFTPRFGWDAHTTECAIVKADKQKIGDFYIALANREKFDFPGNMVGCGVRIYTGSVGDEKKCVEGRRFSYDKSVKENVWCYAASYIDEVYEIQDNPVMVVQTVSKTVPGAIDACYKALDKVYVTDGYWRQTIGERTPEVIKFLKQYNWV